MVDYLTTFMILLSAIFILGLGVCFGFLLAYGKMKGFLVSGKKFDIFKGENHEKELRLILTNLNKLSVAEVEFVMHRGIWGRPIRVLKNINKDREIFEMVSYDEDDKDLYSDRKERAKDKITG